MSADVGREQPAFALVRAHEDQEGADVHGLALETGDGPALCGAEAGPDGWLLIASTQLPLYLIACDGCRGEAAALLASCRAEGVE